MNPKQLAEAIVIGGAIYHDEETRERMIGDVVNAIAEYEIHAPKSHSIYLTKLMDELGSLSLTDIELGGREGDQSTDEAFVALEQGKLGNRIEEMKEKHLAKPYIRNGKLQRAVNTKRKQQKRNQ